MPIHQSSPGFPATLETAITLWRSLVGSGDGSWSDPQKAQRSLLVFAECLKAASGEAFDVEKVLQQNGPT